jgi:hypothetical protein
MKVVCISNKGFYHQLTIGKEYEVLTKTWAMGSKRWYIEGDFGGHIYLNDLFEGGLVMSRDQIREKKLNILLDS